MLASLHSENTVAAKGKDAGLLIRNIGGSPTGIPRSDDLQKVCTKQSSFTFSSRWYGWIAFSISVLFIFPSQRTYGMCFCMYRRFGFLSCCCFWTSMFLMLFGFYVVVVVALKPFSLSWLANRRGARARTETFSTAIVSLSWIGS